MASKRNGTIYSGVTNNLIRRVYEHKNDLIEGFTKKYKCHDLVYFEETQYVNSAIYREKQIKNWKRKWKIKLIEDINPEWRDLYYDYAENDSLDPESSSGRQKRKKISDQCSKPVLDQIK